MRVYVLRNDTEIEVFVSLAEHPDSLSNSRGQLDRGDTADNEKCRSLVKVNGI